MDFLIGISCLPSIFLVFLNEEEKKNFKNFKRFFPFFSQLAANCLLPCIFSLTAISSILILRENVLLIVQYLKYRSELLEYARFSKIYQGVSEEMTQKLVSDLALFFKRNKIKDPLSFMWPDLFRIFLEDQDNVIQAFYNILYEVLLNQTETLKNPVLEINILHQYESCLLKPNFFPENKIPQGFPTKVKGYFSFEELERLLFQLLDKYFDLGQNDEKLRRAIICLQKALRKMKKIS